ncbi:MAG: hypothetical protein RLZZ66_1800 [Pseudomonadota bacterium]|jgi:predicted nucleic acid-binding protein
MINTTVIDTNVILRYLLNDHEAHFEVAKTFMLEVKAGNLFAYIPDSVLAECIFVLLILLAQIEIGFDSESR